MTTHCDEWSLSVLGGLSCGCCLLLVQVDGAHQRVLAPVASALQPLLLRMHLPARRPIAAGAEPNTAQKPGAAPSRVARGYAAAFNGTQALLKSAARQLSKGGSALAALLQANGINAGGSSSGSRGSSSSRATAASMLQSAIGRLRCKLWAWSQRV